MMTFPTEWKSNPNVPNHQPGILTIDNAKFSAISIKVENIYFRKKIGKK
jgi:hypothetical protein